MERLVGWSRLWCGGICWCFGVFAGEGIGDQTSEDFDEALFESNAAAGAGFGESGVDFDAIIAFFEGFHGDASALFGSTGELRVGSSASAEVAAASGAWCGGVCAAGGGSGCWGVVDLKCKGFLGTGFGFAGFASGLAYGLSGLGHFDELVDVDDDAEAGW